METIKLTPKTFEEQIFDKIVKKHKQKGMIFGINRFVGKQNIIAIIRATIKIIEET